VLHIPITIYDLLKRRRSVRAIVEDILQGGFAERDHEPMPNLIEEEP